MFNPVLFSGRVLQSRCYYYIFSCQLEWPREPIWLRSACSCAPLLLLFVMMLCHTGRPATCPSLSPSGYCSCLSAGAYQGWEQGESQLSPSCHHCARFRGQGSAPSAFTSPSKSSQISSSESSWIHRLASSTLPLFLRTEVPQGSLRFSDGTAPPLSQTCTFSLLWEPGGDPWRLLEWSPPPPFHKLPGFLQSHTSSLQWPMDWTLVTPPQLRHWNAHAVALGGRALGRWLGREGGALLNGISVLVQESPEFPGKVSRRRQQPAPQKPAFSGTFPCWHPNCSIPTTRNVKK